MKICLIVDSMGSGGAERVAATLCNAWTQMGRQVTLVATYSGRGDCFYSLSETVSLVFLADLVQSCKKSVVNYFNRFVTLRRLIRKECPDVVISFLPNVNVAAILSTRGLGVPIIACERTDPVAEDIIGPVYRWLRRMSYPQADMITVQSSAAVGSFRRAMPTLKRLGVIHNPLSPELDNFEPKNLTPVGRLRLLAMGRLSGEKQFYKLIEVFCSLSARFPEWDLWIWGEGPLRPQLENRIAVLGLNNRVKLPGRTQSPWEEMAKAEAFVLCSEFEGFPNVLLEAMALGLPCVTFDCPSGPGEITRDGRDALLVPHNDWQKLADGMALVMTDEAVRRKLGKQAAISVRQRYSLSRVLEDWERLFSEVGVAEDRCSRGKMF